MKTWKIITITGFALIAAALLTATAFAHMSGQNFYAPYGTNNPTGIYGAYPGGMMGGGHMGGYGYRYGTTTPPVTSGQYGWDCHGLNGYSGPVFPTTGTNITIGEAVGIAQGYLASLNNLDLVIDEVEEYTLNFYVPVFEKSTGIGAFELVIDKYTGSIYPEMGPNMMWNTKYGPHSGTAGNGIIGGHMRGGMMGGWFTGTTTGPLTVSAEQAKANAQQFLNANIPGTTVGNIDEFYGHYHVHVLSAGNTYGMLSVNGYTGQVWYHNWHGTFIQEVEL